MAMKSSARNGVGIPGNRTDVEVEVLRLPTSANDVGDSVGNPRCVPDLHEFSNDPLWESLHTAPRSLGESA